MSERTTEFDYVGEHGERLVPTRLHTVPGHFAPEEWVERPDSRQISDALGEAAAAFNDAYYESPETADLRERCKEAIAAFQKVLDLTTPPEQPKDGA